MKKYNLIKTNILIQSSIIIPLLFYYVTNLIIISILLKIILYLNLYVSKKTNLKKIKTFLNHFFNCINFHNFSIFDNIYFILKNNYEKRNIINYGYCSKEGYGFVSEIKKIF